MKRPERRNRKIGTKSSGFKHRNDMTIPERFLDQFGNNTRYYERAKADRVYQFKIGTQIITILYENPRLGHSYGCTPYDVEHLMRLLPGEDIEGIELVSFRQPTHKQSQQFPVWGRLIYYSTIGSYEGTCINLEAINLDHVIEWPRKLSVENQAELARLKSDGHLYEETSRTHRFTVTENSLRHHILYRTLLHEIGHWVDYDSKIYREDHMIDNDCGVAYDLYFSRPSVELESFAHRYAKEKADLLRAAQKIPFTKIAF